MASATGVYPVWQNAFKIGKAGPVSESADMVAIAECETFSPTFDVGEETWASMDNEGWQSGLVTANRITLAITAKRCIGDAGNDYVASCVGKMGDACKTKFEWDFPDGSKIAFPANVVVTNVGGGDSTNVAPLEFEVRSIGKPTFTAAGPVQA